MGGYGSGRPRALNKKTIVEDCRVLSADELTRDRLLRPDAWRKGTFIWTRTSTGEEISSCGYEINTLAEEVGWLRVCDTLTRCKEDVEEVGWLRLCYTLTRCKEDVDYRIGLTTIPLPWGGVRWFFLCPSIGCSRRVSKLYLPPGGRYYRCRCCHDLTYRSCQESHRYDELYEFLGAALGAAPRMVKKYWYLALKPLKRTRSKT